MGQKEAFLGAEGDSWFRRNAGALERLHDDTLEDFSRDPLVAALAPLRPRRVLEAGCANGWRLDVIRQLWGSRVCGVEASSQAVADGSRFPDVTLSVSSADSLPFPDDHFDCVILGFVLCWCDRDDLFRIAAEVDRVLRADGYIAILDFQPDFPHAREYAHRQGLSTFKMDYASLWSWHPRYRQVYRELTAHPGKAIDDPDERLAVTVLQG